MTCLLLSTDFIGGGAEYVSRLMAKSLDDVRCVLFTNKEGIRFDFCHVDTIGRISKDTIFGKVVVNLYRLIFIQLTKLRWRPEITISHLEGPNFANLLTVYGGRRVIFVHNLPSRNYSEGGWLSNLIHLLIRLLYKRACIVVAVSSQICRELVEAYGVEERRIHLIANPIDVEEVYILARQQYGDWRDELCSSRFIVNIASFIEQKNHELLIRAYSEAKQSTSNVKLVLIGDGEKREEILRLCGDLHVIVQEYKEDERQQFNPNAEIYFLGYQINPYPLLDKSELFVLTSHWEGLPITILEAMSLGKPLLVSDSSDRIRELLGPLPVSDGIGYLETFARTPYGIIMQRTIHSSEEKIVGAWAEILIEMIQNSNYWERCNTLSRRKAHEYDLALVKNFWLRELLYLEK